jgi:hypothetical protein
MMTCTHSTWNLDEETDAFWGAMPIEALDMVWTTGVGNNGGFLDAGTTNQSYNGRTARYDCLHELTGLPIWVDTSFGLSQAADSWTGIGADELNQRIADGVIGVNITEPPGDYQSRADGLRGQLDSVCE